jgi:DNA uptake protein ComE-like DNA-binding protein
MRKATKTAIILAGTLLLGLGLSPFRSLAAGQKGAKVDINSATQSELEALPGVGAATARKIIAGRPYASVSDLSKAGLSARTIDKIAPLVTAGPAAAPAAKLEKPAKPPKEERAAKPPKEEKMAAALSASKVDLNTASEKELEALPAVGSATARKIIAGRPYSSVGDLAKAGLSAKTIEKISPLVTVGAQAPAALPAAAPAARPSPAAPAGRPAAAAAKTAPSEAVSSPAQPPPAKGMVWVNTDTKVYHREGDRWYGNTKHGKYMTEADALKAGYRASREGASKN